MRPGIALRHLVTRRVARHLPGMAKSPPSRAAASSRAKASRPALQPLDAHLAQLLNPGLPQAKKPAGMGEAPQAGYDTGTVKGVDPALAKALGLPQTEAPVSRRRSTESEPQTYAEITSAKPRRVMQGNVVRADGAPAFSDEMKMGGGLDGLSEADTQTSSMGVEATALALKALLESGNPLFKDEKLWVRAQRRPARPRSPSLSSGSTRTSAIRCCSASPVPARPSRWRR
jgi:hypothetical protein